MALFGKRDKDASAQAATPQVRPVPGKQAFCRVCNARQSFSRCWMRLGFVPQCACCGTVFENAAALYGHFQPVCPMCGEYLEQPGFEYGLCDGCGSKYELVEGTKPGMLPNRKQRADMEKFGKVWKREG